MEHGRLSVVEHKQWRKAGPKIERETGSQIGGKEVEQRAQVEHEAIDVGALHELHVGKWRSDSFVKRSQACGQAFDGETRNWRCCKIVAEHRFAKQCDKVAAQHKLAFAH